jgi:hypothetical protein
MLQEAGTPGTTTAGSASTPVLGSESSRELTGVGLARNLADASLWQGAYSR